MFFVIWLLVAVGGFYFIRAIVSPLANILFFKIVEKDSAVGFYFLVAAVVVLALGWAVACWLWVTPEIMVYLEA